MNVSCPECRSVFRIDPAKVPDAGVRARCNVCGAVIPVDRPPADAFAAAPVGAAVTTPEPFADPRPEPPRRASEPTTVAEPRPEPQPAEALHGTRRAPADSADVPADDATAPVESSAPSTLAWRAGGTPAENAPSVPLIAQPAFDAPARLAAAPVPDPQPAAEARPRPVNPYLNNTPELRARRLARALVSDLVAYNPQKREQGLRDGTLRQLFRDEIRKSWDEYVEQVGASVAESTPHFQDALNDVLAGGRRVF